PLTVVFYTYTSYTKMGWQGPVFCYVYFLTGTLLNQLLISPIVQLWYEQDMHEGNFRFSHTTVRTNAESVAFYGGQKREEQRNAQYLHKVLRNKWSIIIRNIFLNMHMNTFGYLGAILNYLIIGFSVYVLGTFLPEKT